MIDRVSPAVLVGPTGTYAHRLARPGPTHPTVVATPVTVWLFVCVVRLVDCDPLVDPCCGWPDRSSWDRSVELRSPRSAGVALGPRSTHPTAITVRFLYGRAVRSSDVRSPPRRSVNVGRPRGSTWRRSVSLTVARFY